MSKWNSSYKVILAYLAGEVPKTTIDNIHNMDNEGLIKICAVIQNNNSGLEFSILNEIENNKIVVDYVFLLSNKYEVGKRIIKKWNPAIPDKCIIDARIFSIEGMNIERLLKDKIAVAPLPKIDLDKRCSFLNEKSFSIYPKIYTDGRRSIKIGRKTYFSGRIEWGWCGGLAEINVGDFSSIAWDCIYEMSLNGQHNYHRVTTWDFGVLDWWEDYEVQTDGGKLSIGSDVWIGRGCRIKVHGGGDACDR